MRMRSLQLAAVLLAGLFSTSVPAQETQPTIEPVGHVSLGSPDAKVVIDEYASMTCTHCAHFSKDVFPEFRAKYIDTGLVQFTIKPFPLDGIAAGAAVIARCGNEAEYYPRVERLFATQETWAFGDNPKAGLLTTMSDFGMDEASMDACLARKDVIAWVLSTQDYANNEIKLSSTPTFVINGEVHVGALPLEDLSKIIDPMLAAAKPE